MIKRTMNYAMNIYSLSTFAFFVFTATNGELTHSSEDPLVIKFSHRLPSKEFGRNVYDTRSALLDLPADIKTAMTINVPVSEASRFSRITENVSKELGIMRTATLKGIADA
ncbi:Hypothetical predicted protein [Octopus vulgaris]|uniref:Uncharacterized protein n=1 Tax=Octopus vulgaris TaxID=6645 RepID=A0AA36BKR1_OCTVU|nr:Hypothetical predicted protein [Octopus vulgaris]